MVLLRSKMVLSQLLHLDRELALHLVKQHLRLIIHHQYQALLLWEMILVRKPSVYTLYLGRHHIPAP